MNRHRFFLICAIITLFLVLPILQNKSFAQSTDSRYFPETGHTVSGDFLEKYTSVANPETLFGYPITEAMVAPTGSPFVHRQVQYFQRVVFEYRPENAPGHRVQMVPLGSMIFEDTQIKASQALPANQPACQSFEPGGHLVCYAFLTYYRDNGGIEIFGKPLTEMVTENERIMQYFEYARFEWRPELAQGHRVVLTNLGEIFFNAQESRRSWYAPKSKTLNVLSLQVSAFPLNAVLSGSKTQTIYVIVKDQINQGIDGAQVTLTIMLPDGQNLALLMPLTDSNGLTSASFVPGVDSPGRVEILVKVDYANGLTKQTRTSFRIW